MHIVYVGGVLRTLIKNRNIRAENEIDERIWKGEKPLGTKQSETDLYNMCMIIYLNDFYSNKNRISLKKSNKVGPKPKLVDVYKGLIVITTLSNYL